MIQNVIFDFDGTLIDTNELIILSLYETVKNVLHKEISQHDLIPVLGKHLEAQMRYFSEKKYKEMILYYKNYYRIHRDRMIKKFPGTSDLLKKLKFLGCKIGIASAKGRSGILHGLKRFDLNQYVDCIISAYDVENNKPHPECIYKLKDYFQCKNKDMLIIGDSPYDILCGINAQIKTALVSWTIFPKERFEGITPDYIVNEPLDIIKIVTETV
ncbi:MAG: pyrophosphatase PpaX [Clostridiales bacterium]|nr:pyrophosphatase PpaX [Clostridiales bacterium]MDK2932257.1 pyrophosphatase PpaX [Clostridiales bacterium]